MEKRLIFQDEQDYVIFLSYLKNYLLPKNKKELLERLSNPNLTAKERDQTLKLLKLNNFHGEITLLAYCLMPNHFHLLVKQKSGDGIDKFMNSIGVRYAMYFNRKNKRVGAFYQDVYKAVLIDSEPQLLHLTSYIHRNPLKRPSQKLASQEVLLEACFSQPSSLPEYLEQRKTEWVHPEEIISFFSKANPQLSYQAFIEQAEEISPLEAITIDYV
ncbi:MAG: transposase [bacterium]|nr:transposase [bacterium]